MMKNEEGNNVITFGDQSIKMPTRRDILRMGLLGGAAGAMALALGGQNTFGQTSNKNVKPNPKKDVEILNMSIMLEQKAINTYQAAADNKLLPTKAFLDVALQFAADHTAHRDRFSQVVSQKLKGTPTGISNLGTFPIPQIVLKGQEHDVIRYALTLEVLASKAYFDNVVNKLTTDEGRDVSADIMPIENEHAAVFRAVLMVILKQRGLDGDNKVVPYAFLSDEPTPPMPMAD
jgi:rubrerythrin